MTGYRIGQAEFPARAIEPGLYVVATPIGNLGDITLRALEVLASAELIACEDTRMTARLLQRYGITAQTTAYHEHNAARVGPKLIETLKGGAAVALVSDAGTPLVSDPGFRLVEAARAEGIAVWPVPGASSAIAALTASGLPADSFFFDGFLPSKASQRIRRLDVLKAVPASLIFFESPNRLVASLADIAAALGPDRQVAVCRELTKMHEEVRRGSATELAEHFGDNAPRGEIVIVVGPPGEASEPMDADAVRAVLTELMVTHSPSRAAALAAIETGLPKRDLYQLAMELGGKEKPRKPGK